MYFSIHKLYLAFTETTMAEVYSYIQSPIKEHYQYTTIPKQLETFARATPDKDAFVFLQQNGDLYKRLKCKELFENANSFAYGLLDLGVVAGDVVAIGLPNIPEWPICNFGAMMAGEVPMNFMFHQKDGIDLLSTLNMSKAKCFIFTKGQQSQNVDIVDTLISKINADGSASS